MNVALFKKPQTEDLATLTKAWLDAKEIEAAAASDRLGIEQRICALLPQHEPECSVKGDVPGFRVTIRYGVTRKVDSDKLQALWAQLPEKARECFKWSATVTLPKLRGLQEYMPVEYGKLSACLETKPSKPSVSVEAVEA